MNTQPNQGNAPTDPTTAHVPLEVATLFRNRERAFWQSRSNLRDPPELTSLHDLARSIRRGN